MSEASKAASRIEEIKREINQKLEEAQKLADEHGLTFRFIPEQLGDYYGKGNTELTDEPLSEGEWSPSSWSSSSLFC